MKINLPVFFDMDWMCDHPVSYRICTSCGRTAYILSDISRDDDDHDIEIVCDRCGTAFIVTIEGAFDKVVFDG